MSIETKPTRLETFELSCIDSIRAKLPFLKSRSAVVRFLLIEFIKADRNGLATKSLTFDQINKIQNGDSNQ